VQVGGVISERLIHPMTIVLKLVLWFLSTWLGTIILCGMGCLSTKFPFIHTFPDLPLHKRQQIMQSWSLSFFRHLRMFFRTIKLLTLLIFFTQVIYLIDNTMHGCTKLNTNIYYKVFMSCGVFFLVFFFLLKLK